MAETKLPAIPVPDRIDRGPWQPGTGASIEKNFDAIFQYSAQVVAAIKAIPVNQSVTYPLPVTLGGTGINSIAVGGLLYGSAFNTISALAFVATSTRYLANTGLAGTVPAWDQVDLTNGVQNVLPEGNGGTHQSTYAKGDLIYASATATLSRLAFVNTATRYLANTGGGATVPQWDLVDLGTGVQNALTLLSELPSVASGTVLGRSAAGTGVLSALTPSDVLDLIGSTRGAILYRGATGWAILPPSAGALTSLGSGTDPAWNTIPTGNGSLQQGVGCPQGVLAQPVGVTYQDTNTGYLWQKRGGGSTAFGWYYLPLVGPGAVGGKLWAEWALNTGIGTSGFNSFAGGGASGFWAASSASNFTTPNSITSTAYTISGGKIFGTATSAATSGTTFYIDNNALAVTMAWLEDEFDIAFEVLTDSDITQMRWVVGIGSSSLTNTDTPWSAGWGLAFRYSTNVPDGGWVGYSSNGGTGGGGTSVTATVAAIAASTVYKLRIRFVRAGTPTAYFSVNDGTEVAKTTNIPPTGQKYALFVGATTLANVAKKWSIRSMGATLGV